MSGYCESILAGRGQKAQVEAVRPAPCRERTAFTWAPVVEQSVYLLADHVADNLLGVLLREVGPGLAEDKFSVGFSPTVFRNLEQERHGIE